MDINTLITAISEAVVVDDDIYAWCQAQYGRSITVFMNYDVRDLVEAPDCPAVGVFPLEKEYDEGGSGDFIAASCMVHDDRKIEHDGIPNIVDHRGCANVEELRKLVVKCAMSVLASENLLRLSKVSVDYEPIRSFPFFCVHQGLVVETIKPITGSSIFNNE